ncbi:MAG: hypothetical protein ACD_52C00248G0004 [uncultured bacterium]|nr:MAG: hypothetical protein ACD_52C00248G0004 [uncultured bacterium]
MLKKIFIILIMIVPFISFLTLLSPNKTKEIPVNIAPPKSLVTTLIATGDVMLGRKVNEVTLAKNDFTWAFDNTAPLLASADITLINFEGTLITNCPVTQTGFYFCGDRRHVAGLKHAGIDIANLANNHAFNFGSRGLNETADTLHQSGIETIGLGKTVYKNIKGTVFAFLGFSDISSNEPLISAANNTRVVAEIDYARDNSDVLVVSFHWGSEYTGVSSTRQIELAHLAIDSGADLIIGHHPHWTQNTEVYKDKLIVYSLGNFIFDQMWSTKTRQGHIGKFTFKANKLINYELLPIFIEDYGQPRLVN